MGITLGNMHHSRCTIGQLLLVAISLVIWMSYIAVKLASASTTSTHQMDCSSHMLFMSYIICYDIKNNHNTNLQINLHRQDVSDTKNIVRRAT